MKTTTKATLLAIIFIALHILAITTLRYPLGWKELFAISYLYLGYLYYSWKNKKITDIGFVLLSILPFITWTYSHLINLIQYTPYGWVSIIFSIYFFIPYVLITGILLILMNKKKTKK